MSKVAKIVIQDEVNIQITGIDLPVKRALVKAVQFFLPEARYSPAFRMGRWVLHSYNTLITSNALNYPYCDIASHPNFKCTLN
jgi:hypothetical protein